MGISVYIFAISLLCLSLFFALKEREAYSGKEFFVTRFCKDTSPRVEQWTQTHLDSVWKGIVRIYKTIHITIKYLTYLVMKRIRVVVVHGAHVLVRLVRGENMLSNVISPKISIKPFSQHAKHSVKIPVSEKEK